ncbi:MAG: hypothetical protein ABJL72_10325 [Roseobacter sp.]
MASNNIPNRNPEAPIGATARFDAAAFSGVWNVVARFVPADQETLFVRHDANDMTLHLSGLAGAQISGTYRLGVPGELIPADGSGEPLIVFWVDEDFETAAVGTKSGRFGALLDRDGNVPEDRAQAARDIFEFYGWNISALRRTGQ